MPSLRPLLVRVKTTVVVLPISCQAAQRVVPSRRATPRGSKNREEPLRMRPTSKPSKMPSSLESSRRRQPSLKPSHQEKAARRHLSKSSSRHSWPIKLRAKDWRIKQPSLMHRAYLEELQMQY